MNELRLTAALTITAADTAARTITGQIVPFDVVGNTSAGPTIVASDAVIDIPDRVPMLISHDSDRPIGLLASHERNATGISATFALIATGTADQALIEAAAGVRNGLSVGLDVTAYTETPDGLIVEGATLRETSLVTFPAFDSARVADVAASETTTDSPADPVEDISTESEELPVDDTTNPDVAAAALPRVTVTAEAFPYGSPSAAGHSYFRDMLNSRHDVEAARRVDHASRMLTAAETSADVAEIIPPGYRPDLYVGSIAAPRPVIDSFTSYALTDATPFKVPTFLSIDSALIADHVEGTNPTAGAISFDEITVSPKAVSGSYDVSREALDSANPALDQIVMQAIRDDYATKSESYAAAQIVDGASSGDAWVTAGFTAAIMASYADFIDTRRAPADVVLAATAAFSALATEVDDMGRPMNPYAGPSNANGTMGVAGQGLNVAGVNVRPAWALAANGSALIVAKRTDAATWESGLRMWRWEEVAGPANIRFAAFGYIAAAVLRPTGVVSRAD